MGDKVEKIDKCVHSDGVEKLKKVCEEELSKNSEYRIQTKICNLIFEELSTTLNEEQYKLLLRHEDERQEMVELERNCLYRCKLYQE